MTNYLFIDGSYFVFYRFHSLLSWYKLSHPDEDLSETLKVPFENEEFRNQFRKLFKQKLQELPKKLNIEKAKVFIGKDCPRRDIWRNEYHDNYKGTRVVEERKNPKDFFKMVYEEGLFEDAFNTMVKPKRSKIDIVPVSTDILELGHLEADDCIALYINHIVNTQEPEEYSIKIVTGDMDYLQLIKNDNIEIVTAGLKPLRTSKNSYGNYKKDLLMKILIGDKSDNIEPVMKRLGKKSAEPLVMDESGEELNKYLKFDGVRTQYEINKKLIDFDEIPLELKNKFSDLYF